MSVESQHPEYRKYLKVWQRIEAAVEGTRAVKSGKTMFLPKPNQDLDGESFYGTPIQSENDVRYKQYLERAVYTNFCGRTLAGLKGAAFRKYPSIYLAPGVEYLEDSATADGTSLVQLAKDAVAEVLKKGRAALLVDYPSVEEGLTAEQVTRLDLKARIAFYTPEAPEQLQAQAELLADPVLEPVEHGGNRARTVMDRAVRQVEALQNQARSSTCTLQAILDVSSTA